MKYYRLIVLLLLFLPSSLALGEESERSKFIKIFNDSAKKHKGKFESLMALRGEVIGVGDSNATLSEVLDKLSSHPPNTVLLFYDHDGATLRIWALTSSWQGEVEEVKISKEKLENKLYGFRKGINTLGFQIDRAPRPRGDVLELGDQDVKEVSIQEVSRLLLPKDLSEVLKDTENMLVVPSYSIGSIPFGMLSFPGREEEQLVDKVSITVLPSLFDIDVRNVFDRRNMLYKGEHEALVVGNPEFRQDPDWDFPQLPGAEREAKNVAQQLGTEPLIGKNATKANILKKIESSAIIYFATHGVASKDSPLDESFIALSGNTIGESRLTAREIQGLSLRARLVVLSACQTGLGKVEAAGIIGLARAFKIAGVDEVVVSLWNVDDIVTSELMMGFIQKYLKGNQVASYALKEAMINMRKKYKDARLWAPFVVLSGKGSIVQR